jgi:Protein of unknown function, DUF488
MRLFTCSYRAYSSDMGQAVVISRGLPRWRLEEAESWPRCWLLTPNGAYLDAEPGEFTAGYTAQLERFGPERIGRTITRLSTETAAERLVFLCFEADWDRCHRQTFARWMLQRTGELVEEIGAPSQLDLQ